ncbi:TVP38/TMEM64 family protein [Alkalicoccus urumqiensis]|uniref:TVP38/TMEM64 family membrane protein n=1 Tax=Alkalicoccus urumqiensis TaxID=1548213 RepID=A0A2P6MJR2_ALKUR|nr:TVP38/TMEM64 family protein [Alkalicoccus urumqiensis]PRO66511.1 TVP38/TMEM64 family protein [Alkalicoccus urumqiensis]
MPKKYRYFLVITIAAGLLMLLPSVRSFTTEAVRELSSGDTEAISSYLRSFGWWTPVVSTILMTIAVLIAPIPTFLVTFANGMIYGLWWGGLLSWASALIGAVLCYYLAQLLGRPVIEKIVPAAALDWMDTFVKRHGIYAVMLSRVVPITSYGIASYAAGFTAIRITPYLIGTAIGQTPGTFMYAYFGAYANDSLQVIFWIIAAIIGFSALAALVRRIIHSKENDV